MNSIEDMTEKPDNRHGGDWASYEIEYGGQPLDFSMNVNPLGISNKVKEAIEEAADAAERYPDPLCRKLRDRIAEAEGVRQEQIFCGAGAADIIYRLAKAAKTEEKPKLLITAPTFSEYEEAFASEGWQIDRWTLKESRGFRIEEDITGAITEDTAAVFLCEPNNPTGVATDRKLLMKIMAACAERGAMLVIDECFNGFLDDPEAHTMKGFLPEYRDLVILKAFTKLHGMAGVRLGYCLCSGGELPARLYKAGPPWNVSSLAQAAGIAALEDAEYVSEGRKIVAEERIWLKEELSKLGFGSIFGEANYILFKAETGFDDKLRQKGVLIRNCDNYHGLGPGWYRIAVKTHEENLRLIREMDR